MKKLSILCGLFLVFGFMAGPATAANYNIDVGQDGTDNGTTVNLYGQTGVDVDFLIEGYACAPDDNLFGVQTYIAIDETQLTVNSCDPNAAGGCDLTLSGCVQQESGVYSLVCSNFSFIGGVTDLVVGTMNVDCAANGVSDLVMCDDVGGAYDDGFTSDCNLASTFPTCASVEIEQLPPPCSIEVTDNPANITASSINPVTEQFTATESGDCTETPDIVWSDTCTGAAVDQTGLLTVDPTLVGETCQVCVIDNANTGSGGSAVEDCADVIIAPGAACEGEIYLGGAALGCDDPPPVDDPPYNRPGRRGLALTCGDIVDFYTCDNCEENDPVLEWEVVCTKPDVATIVTTDDCSARLTVSDEMCNVLAEVADCTVTVTDTVNSWSDSVDIQVGEITVDLSEETVTPDTDSVEVEISVTNNDHTIRALDITIEECEGGEDNLACTECFADPNRALGFTCTASEQPDGSCQVVIYSATDVIAQGDGPVATVIYDVLNADACPDCVCLEATSVIAADQFNEALCACTDTGEVCFDVCGDIFPQDCLDPGCAPCGDGVVDLFDILEMVDIILGMQIATDCQMDNGDVPNGMPPYCGNPPGDTNCDSDGDIDIFDLLVIIDMALDKPNCCDFCATGAIF